MDAVGKLKTNSLNHILNFTIAVQWVDHSNIKSFQHLYITLHSIYFHSRHFHWWIWFFGRFLSLNWSFWFSTITDCQDFWNVLGFDQIGIWKRSFNSFVWKCFVTIFTLEWIWSFSGLKPFLGKMNLTYIGSWWCLIRAELGFIFWIWFVEPRKKVLDSWIHFSKVLPGLLMT